MLAEGSRSFCEEISEKQTTKVTNSCLKRKFLDQKVGNKLYTFDGVIIK